MPDSDDYEVAVNAASTRIVTLTTGEVVRFTREALEGALRQARTKPVLMTQEHLTFVPPIGYFDNGEIRHNDDGDDDLILYGRSFGQYSIDTGADDPFYVPCDSPQHEDVVKAEVRVEPRNYAAEDWREAEEFAPIPLRKTVAWSTLPPLEWIIAVPVTWSLCKYVGGFLSELGKEHGKSFLEWLRTMSSRARESDRAKFVTISFDLDDGRQVLGFLPFQSVDDQRDFLTDGMQTADYLAEVAGAQNAGVTASARRIAYIFDGAEWKLAWFVNEAGVFRTPYYDQLAPHIDAYLSGPDAESPSPQGEGPAA